MSAVVFKIYDVNYDIRKIKKRKSKVTVRVLAAIKYIDGQKKYQGFEPHCHIYAMNIVTASYHYLNTADNFNSNHGIEPFLETFLCFCIYFIDLKFKNKLYRVNLLYR